MSFFPLVDLAFTLDPHWWLKKKHKTHFATSKNAPGRPAGWYEAVRKLKADHAEGKLSLETVQDLTNMALRHEDGDDTPLRA